MIPLVLVHGGAFAGSCWDPLLPHLREPVLAVDLPGRGRHPGDLAKVDIDATAASVVADIDDAGFDRVVVVGHSLAGVTMPGLVPRLGDRLAGMVFVACALPPDGTAVVDTLPPDIQAIARDRAEASPADSPLHLDEQMALAMFANGLTEEQIRFVLDHLVPEAPRLTHDPVGTDAVRSVANRAWVLCADDAIVLPENQREAAERIDAEIIELDASHMAMVQRPAELAAIIEVLRDRWT